MLMKRTYFYYTMNKIGFQNFRRFENFQPIEYNGITFLVGRNNSGKSTFVKALLLIQDFFNEGNIRFFSIGNASLDDVNIVTYGRAKTIGSSIKDDFITFHYQINNYDIKIVISGDDDKTITDVHEVTVLDLNENFEFKFAPVNQTLTISKKPTDEVEISEQNESLDFLKSEIQRIERAIDNYTLKKSSKNYILLIEELNVLKNKRKFIEANRKALQNGSFYTVDFPFLIHGHMMQMVNSALDTYMLLYKTHSSGTVIPKNISNNFFEQDKDDLRVSFILFYEAIMSSQVIYLGATSTKQSALFSIRDKSNALAQVIHEFYQLRILRGSFVHIFIEKWMKIFEVGDTFNITSHAGEAYEVIIEENGDKIQLSDKGMGSIQAMLLIIRLGTIIYKKQRDGKSYTVIIEEPELNLHPALQSQLAELFHEVYKDFGVKLIIETHSEYLIRKTQLIVKNYEYEVDPNVNPFSVLYFDKDLTQWKMEYREDGKFKNSFGRGFYDESNNLTFDLL